MKWIRSKVSARDFMWKPIRSQISTRARLHSLVDRLELPVDWTVEEFIASVEHARGRRIVRLLLPPTAPVGLCGLWLACWDCDVILLRQASDPAIELHVALHEVSHMLLGHGQDTSMPTAEWTRLTSELALDQEIDPATVGAARGLSSYDSSEEYEAELFATLIGFRARSAGPRRDPLVKDL